MSKGESFDPSKVVAVIAGKCVDLSDEVLNSDDESIIKFLKSEVIEKEND